jgi:flagellin
VVWHLLGVRLGACELSPVPGAPGGRTVSRISTNIPALTASFQLNRNVFRLNTSLNRLATGLKINRGADNPAGLIASENLRSHLRGLEAASSNIDRAHAVLSVAETGMSQVGSLLRDLDGLVVAAANTAGMSKGERQALQLQADSILQTIDRLGVSTGFAGSKQLDGSRAFVMSDVSSQVADVTVTGASLAGGESVLVDVAVTQAAEKAQVALDFDGAQVDLGSSGDTFVFSVEGELGEVELTVTSGATLEDVAAAVNAHSSEVGVEASVEDGRVVLRGDSYGSESFVSVEILDDGGAAGGTTGVYTFVEGDPAQVDVASQVAFAVSATVRDEGRDVAGTINGQLGFGEGTTLSVSSQSLSISISLGTGAVGPGQANAVSTGTLYGALTITGGPTFQIAADAGPAGRIGFGLPEVSTRTLGRSGSGSSTSLVDLMGGGRLNLVSGDMGGAQQAVRSAISTIASEQGRIGAFRRNTLEATQRSLENTFVNIASADSLIRDTDFAFEMSSLRRSQFLYQASTSVLGQASRQPFGTLNLIV